MARVHTGTKAVIGVAGLGIIGACILGGTALSYGFGWWTDNEEARPTPRSGFEVKYAPDPEKPEEPKKEPTLAQKVQEKRVETKTATQQRAPSLTDKFLTKVNSGEMLTFGKEIESREGGFSGGSCSTLQPVRVRAMIADNATTDQPGMAIGMVSEPIQGEESGGIDCIAIPAGSVVAFMVAQAGEYATNRVDVKVEAMWLPDGHKVDVGQPAKYVDGVPGVVGKANHHTMSKTLAMMGAVGFRVLDNVTSFGQFSSGDATDPIEDAIAKTFNRPSEISFTGGKAVEFDLLPVTTPGY